MDSVPHGQECKSRRAAALVAAHGTIGCALDTILVARDYDPRIKVVFHYPAGPGLRARLNDAAGSDLTVEDCPENDDARFAELMTDADVLWHVLKPVTAEAIGRAPRLRLIQKIGVGVNTIDLEAAQGAGHRSLQPAGH